MNKQILDHTGKVIFEAAAATLKDALLRDANLSGADLSGANLSGASLSGANRGRPPWRARSPASSSRSVPV